MNEYNTITIGRHEKIINEYKDGCNRVTLIRILILENRE